MLNARSSSFRFVSMAIVSAVLLFGGALSGATTSVFQPGDGEDFSACETAILRAETMSPQESEPYGRCRTYADSTHVSLIRFPNVFGNLSGQVPPNASIISASLKIKGTDGGETYKIISAYRVLQAWDIDGENAVSWSTRDTDQSWTVPGVGYVSENEMSRLQTAEDTKTYSQALSWLTFDVSDAVQAWSENIFSNYGLVLVADNAVEYQFYFNSEDGVVQSERPILEIVWEPGTSTDATAPGTVSYAQYINYSDSVSLDWQNPADDDLYQVVILSRVANSVTEVPVTGTLYDIGNVIGNSTVAFVGTWNGQSVPESFLHENLTSDQTYHYAIFCADEALNYSSAVSLQAYPSSTIETVSFRHTDAISSLAAPNLTEANDLDPAVPVVFDVLAPVKNWVNDSAANNGLEIYANGELDYRFASKELGNAAIDPLLTVQYTTTHSETLSVSQDAWVSNATPDSVMLNYYMSVEVDSGTLIERSYVKFDTSSIPANAEIQSATMRLWCIRENSGGGAGEDYTVKMVSGSWSDSTLTFNASENLTLGDVVCVLPTGDHGENTINPPVSVDFNVTSAVIDWVENSVTNDGLAILPEYKYDIRFSTKEAGVSNLIPTLTVVYTVSSTVALDATQDAWVKKSDPSAVQTSSYISVETGYEEELSYVQFDVSGIPTDATIDSAEMTLWCVRENSGGHSDDIFRIRQIADTAWSESTLTYSMAMALEYALPVSAWLSANLWEEYPDDNDSTPTMLTVGDKEFGLAKAWLNVPNIFGSATGQVPSNAAIVSATLKLYSTRTLEDETVAIYRVAESVSANPTAITWNERSDGIDWTVPGLSYVSPTEYSRSGTDEAWQYAETSGDYIEFDVTDLVKHWSSQPTERWGFTVENESLYAAFSGKYLEFIAPENADETKRPVLEIRYSMDANAVGSSAHAPVPAPVYVTPPQPDSMVVCRALAESEFYKATVFVRLPDDYTDVRKIRVYRKEKDTTNEPEQIREFERVYHDRHLQMMLTDNDIDVQKEYVYYASFVNSDGVEGAKFEQPNNGDGAGSSSGNTQTLTTNQYDNTCKNGGIGTGGGGGSCCTVNPVSGDCPGLGDNPHINGFGDTIRIEGVVYSSDGGARGCSSCGASDSSGCELGDASLKFEHYVGNRMSGSSRFGALALDNWSISIAEASVSNEIYVHVNIPKMPAQATYYSANRVSFTQMPRAHQFDWFIVDFSVGEYYVFETSKSTRYRFEFNETLDAWQWVSIQNLHGATTTLTYNSFGNLVEIRDPLNRTITLNYISGWTNDLVSEVILPDDVTTVSYAYNSGYTRSITNVSYPNGDVATFLPGEDAFGYYLLFNEPYGPDFYRNAKVYINSIGRVIAVRDAANNRLKYSTRTDTAEDGNNLYTFQENGKIRSFFNDGDNLSNFSKYQPTSGRLQDRTYNNFYLPLTNSDAFGRTKSSSYDTRGNLLTRTDFDNVVTTYTYNAFGQRLTEIDRGVMHTSHSYTATGNRLYTVRADGTDDAIIVNNVYVSYDFNTPTDSEIYDQPDYSVDPNGYVTKYEYNALRQRVKVIHPTDSTKIDLTLTQRKDRSAVQTAVLALTYSTNPYEEYSYYLSGLVETATNEVGDTTTYFYDSMRRVTSIVYEDTTTETFTYSGAGQSDTRPGLLVTQTDRNGFKTLYEYDAEFRQTKVKREISTGGPYSIIETVYNPTTGQIDRVISDGDIIDYVRDGEQRVVQTKRYPLTESAPLISKTTYDLAGRVSITTAPFGFKTWYGYDMIDRNVQTTLQFGVTEPVFVSPTPTMSWSRYSAVITINDAVTTSVTYNSDNTVASTTNAVSQTTSYGYDFLNRRTTVTDPLGTISTIEYDANGNETRSIRRNHSETLNIADDDIVSENVFGARNLLLMSANVITPATNLTPYALTFYEYDAARRMTRTDRYVKTTETVGAMYTDYGVILNEKYEQDIDENYAHIAHSERTWSCCGRLATELTYASRPAAPTATLTADINKDIFIQYTDYDGNGNLLTKLDAEGNAWNTTYDGLGRKSTATDPTGVVTEYAYYSSAADAITVTGSPTGAPSLDAGFGAGVTVTVDPSGKAISTTSVLDGLSRTMWMKSPERQSGENHFSTLVYDTPSTTAVGGANAGAGLIRSRIIANNGRTTDIYSDGIGRRTKSIDDTAGLAIITQFEYYADSQIKKIIDANGNETNYTYNSLGLKLTEYYDDGKGWVFSYDPLGRLWTKTDGAGKAATHYYDDPLGRQTEIVYSGTGVNQSADEIVYDDDSQIVKMESTEYQNRIYTYLNTAGQKVKESQVLYPNTANEKIFSFEFDYSQNGLREKMSLPSIFGTSGRLLFYEHDEAGRMMELSTVDVPGSPDILKASRDTAGRIDGYEFGNDTTVSFALLNTGQVSSINHTFTAGSLNFAMTYDASGLVKTKTNSRNANLGETYNYDAVDRLDGYARTGTMTGLIKDQSFDLDDLGNWTSTTFDGNTETRSHNGLNQVTARSGDLIEGATGPLNLTNDEAGNLTSDGYRSFTWDANNRLTSVTVASGSPVGVPGTYYYRYDALGRRIMADDVDKDGYPVTKLFLYDGWRVIEERRVEASGSNPIEYAYPLDKVYSWGFRYLDELISIEQAVDSVFDPLAESYVPADCNNTDKNFTDNITGELVHSLIYFAHQDNIFNVCAITNSAGEAIEEYAYNLYGLQSIINDNADFNSDYGFTCQRNVKSTGLMYHKTRNYNPITGVFCERNIWGYIQERYSLYDYCMSNPSSLTEPYSAALGLGAAITVAQFVEFVAAVVVVTTVVVVGVVATDYVIDEINSNDETAVIGNELPSLPVIDPATVAASAAILDASLDAAINDFFVRPPDDVIANDWLDGSQKHKLQETLLGLTYLQILKCCKDTKDKDWLKCCQIKKQMEQVKRIRGKGNQRSSIDIIIPMQCTDDGFYDHNLYNPFPYAVMM